MGFKSNQINFKKQGSAGGRTVADANFGRIQTTKIDVLNVVFLNLSY